MSNEMNKFVCQQLDELKALFLQKQDQYATEEDELANFRCGALLNGRDDDEAGMFEELKGYMSKHIAFIYSHDIHGEKVAESLKDIAVYSLIALYMKDLTTIKTSKIDNNAIHRESHCGVTQMVNNRNILKSSQRGRKNE